MDMIPKEEIRDLMLRRDENCVSVFLPTHRAGREIEQDPIRLDNLLRKAEKELIDREMRSPDAKGLLDPAYDLMKNGFFTRHQADGLSIFISPNLFRYFRMPIHFEEQLTVSNRFYLKPLVPILNAGNRFDILAVSQKSVRLFKCTEFGVSEVDLKDVPKTMREALGYDDSESRLLFRVPSQGSSNRDVSSFHGHGGGIEDDKEDLVQYFQKLRDSLHPYFRDERAPLIFAGVEYLFPIFKQVNLYPHILEKAIDGNPDGLDATELQRRGLEIAGPYFMKEQQEAVAHYLDLTGSRLSSAGIQEILPASLKGRIDILFVDTGTPIWGKFDPESGQTEVHKERERGDEDLLDLATNRTFLSGGAVYALSAADMPESRKIAAIFRY
jgi:hypothetical protein